MKALKLYKQLKQLDDKFEHSYKKLLDFLKH